MNVETAAYALLAQMVIGRLKFAGPIVTWLTSKKTAQGGFISTQVRYYTDMIKLVKLKEQT